MTLLAIHRGDIFEVRLNPTEGHEQAKVRPCVVISNDRINGSGDVVIIVPLTTKGAATADSKHRILLKELDKIQETDTQGCPGESVALVYQLRAVDPKKRFMEAKRRAQVTAAALARIEAGLVYVMDIY
jgi:mRNA interferase MazF